MSHEATGQVSALAQGGLARIMGTIEFLDTKLAAFSGWVIVVMMLTISYDVIMRYLFRMPTTWSFEINRYMLILVMFFGSGYTFLSGGHVGVDILTDRLEARKQLLLGIFVSVISGIYAIVFFIESWTFAWDAFENGIKSTEYLAWPLWPMRSFLVIGAGMLFLECVIKFIRSVAALRTGE